MLFGKKKKMTETQKARIQTSNCRTCAWRVPVNRNAPIACLWGIMDNFDIDACNGRAECDRYISDIALEGHLKMLLNLKGGDGDGKNNHQRAVGRN